MRFFWNVLRALSALVIPALGALFALKRITQEQFLVAVLVLGLYLILREALDLFPKRERPLDIQRKIHAGDTLLKSMLAEYGMLLQAKGVTLMPDIRANVMMVRHEAFFRRRMQIAFEASLDKRTAYGAAEKALKWTRRNGAVGRVWSQPVEQVFCKSDRVFWKSLTAALTTAQQAVVSQIGSVFIVPIHSNAGSSVIGLLCLDSRLESNASYLADEDMKALVRGYADVLRPLCPENGISTTGK